MSPKAEQHWDGPQPGGMMDFPGPGAPHQPPSALPPRLACAVLGLVGVGVGEVWVPQEHRRWERTNLGLNPDRLPARRCRRDYLPFQVSIPHASFRESYTHALYAAMPPWTSSMWYCSNPSPSETHDFIPMTDSCLFLENKSERDKKTSSSRASWVG